MYPVAVIGQILSESFLNCSEEIQRPRRVTMKIQTECNPDAYKFVACVSSYSFTLCPENEQENTTRCTREIDLIRRMNYGMLLI